MFKYSQRRAKVTLTDQGQARYRAFYNYHYGFKPSTDEVMVMDENKLGMIFENRRDWVSEIEYNYQWPADGRGNNGDAAHFESETEND